MGLAEKRVIKKLEESTIPDAIESIKKLIGKAISIDINWDSFETEKELLEIQHQCLGRIIEGIEIVAKDNLGKEALNESLEKITINNIADANDKQASFSNGELLVNGKWQDFSSGIFISEHYAEQLEKGL